MTEEKISEADNGLLVEPVVEASTSQPETDKIVSWEDYQKLIAEREVETKSYKALQRKYEKSRQGRPHDVQQSAASLAASQRVESGIGYLVEVLASNEVFAPQKDALLAIKASTDKRRAQDGTTSAAYGEFVKYLEDNEDIDFYQDPGLAEARRTYFGGDVSSALDQIKKVKSSPTSANLDEAKIKQLVEDQVKTRLREAGRTVDSGVSTAGGTRLGDDEFIKAYGEGRSSDHARAYKLKQSGRI